MNNTCETYDVIEVGDILKIAHVNSVTDTKDDLSNASTFEVISKDGYEGYKVWCTHGDWYGILDPKMKSFMILGTPSKNTNVFSCVYRIDVKHYEYESSRNEIDDDNIPF